MPAYGNFSETQLTALLDYIEATEVDPADLEEPEDETIRTEDYVVDAEILSKDISNPWSIAFIDEKHALITEQGGGVRQLIHDFLQPDPVQGTPEVLHFAQGGMLDVAIDPNYAENGWVYLSYSHPIGEEKEGNRPAMTRVVRGRIQDNKWVDQEVVWEARREDYRTSAVHYGCRIDFDEQGRLYFSLGDRGRSPHAQQLDKPNGKVHRVNPDGSIPEENPFVDQKDAYDSIFSYGNRNPQGLVFHPETGELWSTEHGPKGGDELNLIQKGNNYGWPVITYGTNYNGTPITDITHKEGMEQPVKQWTPSIAVCGLDFYTGDKFPKWQNNLLVGTLKYKQLRRIKLDGHEVVEEEILMKDRAEVRDVETSPDGSIYILLNKPDAIMKWTPAGGSGQ
jgi:glucose/arabinose dehydrogenase